MKTDNRQQLTPIFQRLRKGVPRGMVWISDGWVDLVLNLDKELSQIDPDYTIQQVKEKFGALRFYASPSANYVKVEGEYLDDPFNAAISRAEQASSRICEDCGSVGSVRDSQSWYVTLCDNCEASAT